MVDTMSREDYERELHFGSVGPTAAHLDEQTVAIWRRDSPTWAGKYWIYNTDAEGICCLRPLNVTNRKKQ